MTKQSKSLIVVVAILVILGVILTCTRISIGNKEDELYNKLNSYKNNLPPSFKVENNMIKGMFATRGDYNLYQGQNSIKVHYKIEHGLLSWFGGPMNFHSKTTINYPNLKSTDPIKTNGTISQDGSVDLNSNSVETTYLIDDKANLVFAPSTSHFLYDGKTGDITSTINIPSINLNDEKDKLKITNILVNRKTNEKDPLLGSLDLSIDSMTDSKPDLGNLTLGKFNLKATSENVNNKFNAKVDLVALDLETPQVKNNKIELAYSILGLNYQAIQDIRKIGNEGSITQNPEAKKSVAHDINQVVQSGFSIVIDKLYAEKQDGKINLNASYVLAPSAQVNFENNSQFNLNVNSEGSWIVPVAQGLSELLGVPITTNGKNLDVKLNYSKGNFTANSLPMNSPLKEELQGNLQKLDMIYKLMFDEQNGYFFKSYSQLEQQSPNATEENDTETPSNSSGSSSDNDD